MPLSNNISDREFAKFGLLGSNEVFVRSQCTFDSSSLDAFGRLQVADPYKLFEYSASMYYDTKRYWSEFTSGGATIARNATTTQFELSTTTSSGDEAIMQTRRQIQYNKGNAQEIFIIVKPEPVENQTREWMYGDVNNGLGFRTIGNSIELFIRTNTSGFPVETVFAQSEWNDPLDGTGPSKLTMDMTKQHVFKIDFGWLSSRGARFFIDVQGTFVMVKDWLISGTLDMPFMRTGNLPIRFRIKNTGTTLAPSSFCWSCCAVQSSGSEVQEGAVRSVSTGVTAINITTTPALGAAVRLKSTFLNGSIQPLDFKMLPVSGNSHCYFRVLYNPTVVGATWDTARDGIYEAMTGYTSYSGGSVVTEGHFPLANKQVGAITALRDLLNDIYVGRSIVNERDILAIEFRTDTSSGSTYFEGSFKEFA